MGVYGEIIKRALEMKEPVITLENIQASALKVARSNPALVKLVNDKCMKHPELEGASDDALSGSRAAITLIIEGLEHLDDESETPGGSYLEYELLQVFRKAEIELLVDSWNEMMANFGWSYVNDGEVEPPLAPYLHLRDGWMVRKTQRLSMSTVIEIMLTDRIRFINEWIQFYTKTLYINTSTEEWAEVLHVDPNDRCAIEQMNRQLRRLLMGE